MSPDRIEEIKSLLSKITAYPWHKIIGRVGGVFTINGKQQRTYTRWDIYSGDESEVIETEKLQDLQKELFSKTRKQVVHFHPETPAIYEKNENTENDMAFIVQAPEIVLELLCEIERLSKEE